jgi:monofunctional glycosyltransferase
VSSKLGKTHYLLRAIAIAVVVILLAPPTLLLLYRFVAPPITPLMIIRTVQGYPLNKEWVPLEATAPTIREAVITSEDAAFCEERWGFDSRAIDRQVSLWERGGHPKGASTITMQTARNLFLWPGRNVGRKLLEAWLTPQIASILPKRRVLEIYLNVAEFGPGIYGVEAASRAYFAKPASELSLREAALLVQMLPDPLHRTIGKNDAYMQERASFVETAVHANPSYFTCIK